MEKKGLRKFFVLLVSVAMTLAMSIPAFAEPTGSTWKTVSTSDELNAAVQQGGNIKLGAKLNIADSITIPDGKTVVLDLNGDTLDEDNKVTGPTITVQKGANFTLTNSNTSTSVVENNESGQPVILNNGTTTIEGKVKLQDTGNDQYYVLVNHGDMTINSPAYILIKTQESALIENGYSSYKSGDSIEGYNKDVNQPNPKLTINGGTFDGGKSNVKNDDGGVVTINGGTFRNARNAILNWNKMTINGGDFEAAYNLIENLRDDSNKSDSDELLNQGDLTITGGKFTATLAKDTNGKILGVYPVFGCNENDDPGGTEKAKYTAAKTTITGGTFTDRLYGEVELNFTITGGTFAAMPSYKSIPSGYSIKKDSHGYTIEPIKLTNEWTEKLHIEGWTFGEKANEPKAKAKYGTPTYKYYDKAKKELSKAPTEPGNYFVKAFVEGAQSADGFYNSLESDYVPFAIAKESDSFTTPLTMASWTYGNKAAEPSAAVKEGKITYTYYDKNKKALSKKPTLPGTYYVKASVAATAEVKGVESDYVKFYIYQPAFVLTAKTKRTADKLSWTKVSGADTYKVYYGRCSKPLKLCKTVKGTSLTKKGLKKYRNYKFIVKAYKTVKGKRVFIAKSNSAHVIGAGYSKRFTEARSVSVTESTMDLTVNGLDTVDAQQAKLKKGRRFLGGSHAALFRFMSSDKAVAQVNSKGEVTGVSAGTCTVYVIAQNGRYKTVTVTVK
jgi:hypothetical protein